MNCPGTNAHIIFSVASYYFLRRLFQVLEAKDPPVFLTFPPSLIVFLESHLDSRQTDEDILTYVHGRMPSSRDVTDTAMCFS